MHACNKVEDLTASNVYCTELELIIVRKQCSLIHAEIELLFPISCSTLAMSVNWLPKLFGGKSMAFEIFGLGHLGNIKHVMNC